MLDRASVCSSPPDVGMARLRRFGQRWKATSRWPRASARWLNGRPLRDPGRRDFRPAADSAARNLGAKVFVAMEPL